MDKNLQLEIAKLIGEPISTQLPVPVELGMIADTFTAEAGEHVWKYSTLDDTYDVVLSVDTSNGAITVVKRTPLGDVEMPFQGLNSKMEYVLVDAVLASPDTDILSRRKESITRGMDKRELATIFNAIQASVTGNAYVPAEACEEIVAGSGEDLYDLIVKMKHAVEDWGDNYVLLVGSTAKEAIDNYDKSKAGTFMNGLSLITKLTQLGIEVVKVFGKYCDNTTESDGNNKAILGATKMILVARNSRIAEGKPVKFVRRKIAPAIAQLMGADVDKAQRALVVGGVPVNVAGTNTLAYSCYGYESIIFAITNPKAIKHADAKDVI